MHKRILFIVLALVLVVSCSKRSSQPEDVYDSPSPKPKPTETKPQAPKQQWRTVEQVVDGNTIVLDGGEEVRLIGVDTPESVHLNKPVARFAKEVAGYARTLTEGKKVWLEYDQTRTDKYGRTLAYVHLAGGSVLNEEIIRYGYGRTYIKYSFKYKERYLELENKAREAKCGAWAILSAFEETKDVGGPNPAVDKWLRERNAEQPVTLPEAKPESETVYIAKTGKKYHRGSCSYLRKSRSPISKEEAIRQGYTPCSRCKP